MKWFGLTLLVLMAAYLITSRGPAQYVGEAAPELSAEKWFNTQQEVSLSGLRGKVVVVEFWAGWCFPCREAVPHLNRLHDQWKDRGVVIIGLTDEPASIAKDFIDSAGIRYIIGAGSRLVDQLGVRWIPYVLVIDGAGQITWSGSPEEGLDEAIRLAHSKLTSHPS